MKIRRWIVAAGLAAAASLLFFRPSPAPSSEKLFRQALDSLNSGRSDGVTAAFRLLKADKEYWRHLAVLDAVLFLRGGKPEEALRRLSPIPLDPEVRELSLLYAGEALYTLSRLAESQQILQVLRQEYPDNLNARRWLGAIYYDLGAYDAATVEMKAIAKGAPQDYRPHHLLGIMYQDFESDDEAIQHFRLALDRNPPVEKKARISAELAAVLIRNRQYQEAIQILESLPDSVETHVLSARSFWNQGNRKRAEEFLKQAESAGSLGADGMQLKADMLADAGKLSESIAILQELLKQFPDRNESRYQLAMACQQDGKLEEGRQQLAIWEHRRDMANELQALNLTAVSDPYDAEVRDRLADLCQELGRDRLAEMWRRAAESCRNDVSVIEVPSGMATP